MKTTLVLGLLFCACAPHGRDVITVESNDLGITELEVLHEHVQDDQLLTLRGFDQDGTVLATAVLRTGMVMYGADTPETLNPGTELKLTVADLTSSFKSPDRVPHLIYEPLSPQASTFVGLKAVASAIDKEAGIKFAPRRSGANTEIPFAAAACSGSRFPTNKGGAAQCCQDDSNTWHVNANNAVVNRFTYAPSFPTIPTCRKSDGTTGCTTACLYGPCGAAIGTISGSNGHIFHPTSQPTVCGRDDGSGTFVPEAYTTQTLYGGVTASCLCTGCNADGTAQCGFHDDFTRTSGLGSNWNVPSGSFSTDGNNAKSTTAASGNLARIISTYNTNDYAITASVSSPLDSTENGVVARAGTGYGFVTDRYEAVINQQNGGSVELWRINNEDTYTALGFAPVPVTAGTFYTLKLVATGTNPVHLEAWFQGTLKVVYDDFSASRLQSGNTGLVTWDSNTKWDYIDVMPAAQQPSPPPAPPTGSPFIDDFTRTSTLSLGSNWIVDSGGTLTTNGTQGVSGSSVSLPDSALCQADVQSNNYAITAVMSVPSAGTDSGIFARSADPISSVKDKYTAWIMTSGGTVGLSRYRDWEETVLSSVSTTITADTNYTLKLVATGTNPVHLEVWLNGVKKINYDDSSIDRITSGGHGIYSYVLAGGAKWDSYRVDAL